MSQTSGDPVSRVLAHFDHVASFIINADHSIVRPAENFAQSIALATACGSPYQSRPKATHGKSNQSRACHRAVEFRKRVVNWSIWLVFFQNRINVQLNMSERENGQLPLPKRAVRSRISADVWQQVRTAYASGIGLREIARNMSIPEGTVLARAKREGWTKQIQSIKALAKREDTSPAVAPFEAASASMQQRGERIVGDARGIVSRQKSVFTHGSLKSWFIGERRKETMECNCRVPMS
jgi:hypothetical protein